MFFWANKNDAHVMFDCVIGALIFMNNSLVVIAIARTPSLHTVTNCFIGSLATADALIGLGLPVITILDNLGLPQDFQGCLLANSIVVLINNISILNLLTVALERYLAISDPFCYNRIMSIEIAFTVVALSWTAGILIGLIPMMGWNTGKEGFKTCSFTSVIALKYMVYLIFFIVTLVPLISMILIYSYIFHIARKQQRRIESQTFISSGAGIRLPSKIKQRRREMRTATGLALVVIVFAVSWMPIHIIYSIRLFLPEHAVPPDWYLAAIQLSHVHSFINPFLYAFANTKIKTAIMELLLCGRCKRFIPREKTHIANSEITFHGSTFRRALPKESVDLHYESSMEELTVLTTASKRVKFNTVHPAYSKVQGSKAFPLL